MKIQITKTSGLFLLLLGVGIILWTLYFSYGLFTGKRAVPELFSFEKAEEIAPTKESPSDSEFSVEEMFQGALQEQLKGMLPSNAVPLLLNLSSWAIFAGIAIFGGAQISNIGIKLVK